MDTQVAYILSLGVVKEFRKHGIGKRQKAHGLNHCCPLTSYQPPPHQLLLLRSSAHSFTLRLFFLVQMWGQVMSSQCSVPPTGLHCLHPPRSVTNRSATTPVQPREGVALPNSPVLPDIVVCTGKMSSVQNKDHEQLERQHFTALFRL